MELPFAESWKIKMVEPIKKSTRQEREKWLEEAHNNVEIGASLYRFIDRLGNRSDVRSSMVSIDDGRREL